MIAFGLKERPHHIMVEPPQDNAMVEMLASLTTST